MAIDQTTLDNLVAALSEGLNVEIKRWISPTELGGLAKIIKGILGIRNRNGGFFIVGFDDKTLLPDEENRIKDYKSLYHIDEIQRIVSDFASEVFEVTVGFGRAGT
jgi:hypothetical protein